MTVQRVLQETSHGGVWRSLADTAVCVDTEYVSPAPCLLYDEPCTIQHWQLRDLLQVPAYPFGSGRYVYFVSEGALRRLDLKHWQLLAQQENVRGARASSISASARVASRVRDALESLARERYLFLLRRELRESQRRTAAGATARARVPEVYDSSHLWENDDGEGDIGRHQVPDSFPGEHPWLTEQRLAGVSDQGVISLERADGNRDDEYGVIDVNTLPLMLPYNGAEAAAVLAGNRIDEQLRLELEQSARALTHLVREVPVADTRIRLVRLGDLPPARERTYGLSRPRVVAQRTRSRLAAAPESVPGATLRPRASFTAATSNIESNQEIGAPLGLRRPSSLTRGVAQDTAIPVRESPAAWTNKQYRSQRLQKYSFWPTCLCVMEPYVAVGGQSGQLIIGLLSNEEREAPQVEQNAPFDILSSEAVSDEESSLGRRLEMDHSRQARYLDRAYRWGRSEYDAALEGSGLWGSVLNRSASVIDTAQCRTLRCGELSAGVVNNAITMAPTPSDAALAHSWYLDAMTLDSPSLSWKQPRPRHLFVSTNDESIKIFDLERMEYRDAVGNSSLPSSQTVETDSVSGVPGDRPGVIAPDEVLRCSTNINYAAVSPDAKRLLAVGDSADVFVFDTRSPTTGGSFCLTATLREAHDAGICAAWHPSGRQFAVASQDGLCCVWDARYLGKTLVRYTTQSLFPVRSACRSVKFSPAETDLDLLVFAEHQNYVHIACARTYSEYVQTLSLADLDTAADQDLRRTIWHEHEEHIAGVGFARQGRSLVIGTELGIREYLIQSRQRHELPDFIL
jgi:hypothetical protein